jgi:hypothetical protein
VAEHIGILGDYDGQLVAGISLLEALCQILSVEVAFDFLNLVRVGVSQRS